jgi:hypothetical protein
MKISEDMFSSVKNLNMKKYSGKIQNPVPLATIREVKVELPNWD